MAKKGSREHLKAPGRFRVFRDKQCVAGFAHELDKELFEAARMLVKVGFRSLRFGQCNRRERETIRELAAKVKEEEAKQ